MTEHSEEELVYKIAYNCVRKLSTSYWDIGSYVFVARNGACFKIGIKTIRKLVANWDEEKVNELSLKLENAIEGQDRFLARKNASLPEEINELCGRYIDLFGVAPKVEFFGNKKTTNEGYKFFFDNSYHELSYTVYVVTNGEKFMKLYNDHKAEFDDYKGKIIVNESEFKLNTEYGTLRDTKGLNKAISMMDRASKLGLRLADHTRALYWLDGYKVKVKNNVVDTMENTSKEEIMKRKRAEIKEYDEANELLVIKSNELELMDKKSAELRKEINELRTRKFVTGVNPEV